MLGLGRCTCTRTVYGIYSLSDAPIVLRPACLGLHVELILVQFMAWTAWAMHRSCPRAWVRPPYLYPYSIWHRQPGRCTDRTIARMFGLARCTCTPTVFGMDRLSDARSVQGCLRLPVYWRIFVISHTYSCDMSTNIHKKINTYIHDTYIHTYIHPCCVQTPRTTCRARLL